jgi:hypothetical protein
VAKKFPAFVKTPGSLLCSQKPATDLSWTWWSHYRYPTYSYVF